MFGALIIAAIILLSFPLLLRGTRFRLISLLVVSLVSVAAWAPCSDWQMGRKEKAKGEQKSYFLKKEAPAGPEEKASEQHGMEETFPLYGSREERIFKPWLKVFYYGKNRGFRLNLEYEDETEDRQR